MLAELMKQLILLAKRPRFLRGHSICQQHTGSCAWLGVLTLLRTCVFSTQCLNLLGSLGMCAYLSGHDQLSTPLSFIRCARCVQWIAAPCLHLPTTCYYDDFVVATTPQLAANSEASMSLLLDLLGWRFDEEGPNADSFSAMVVTLTVQFNLAGTVNGYFEICNAPRHAEDVLKLIDVIVCSG